MPTLIERSDRMKAAARIRDLELELAETRAWADTMLRKIEVLEARIEAKESALMRIDAALAPARETK